MNIDIPIEYEVELKLGDELYDITYREPSDAEESKLKEEFAEAFEIEDEVEKFSRKLMYLARKREIYAKSKNEKNEKKELEIIDKIEALEKEFTALKKRAEHPENYFRKLFDICIDGPAKKDLQEDIEARYSFKKVLANIKKNTTK